jgi:hypothetical protein
MKNIIGFFGLRGGLVLIAVVVTWFVVWFKNNFVSAEKYEKIKVAMNEVETISKNQKRQLRDSSVKIEGLQMELARSENQIGDLQRLAKSCKDTYKGEIKDLEEQVVALKESCNCPECERCIGIKVKKKK